MDVTRAAQVVVIMLLPTLVVAAALYLPRAVRFLVRRAVTDRRAPAGPARPPIEDLAADLRRLLHRHEETRRSTGTARRAQHLRALEAAITDCVAEAASALDLDEPPVGRPAVLSPAELRARLRRLAAAGLVLPPVPAEPTPPTGAGRPTPAGPATSGPTTSGPTTTDAAQATPQHAFGSWPVEPQTARHTHHAIGLIVADRRL